MGRARRGGVRCSAHRGSAHVDHHRAGAGLDLAGTIRSEAWTPLSRVIGVIPGETNSFGLVFYDRVDAPVVNYAPGQPSPDWPTLHLGPQTIPATLRATGEALVIGGGAGATSRTSGRRASTTST